MKAIEHTLAMLSWWKEAGIDRVDLAVCGASGEMSWHHDLRMPALPLRWARALNVRRGEVYIRPACTRAWPVVFLDDVACDRALAIKRKYRACVVQTSREGGCHVWLGCAQVLDEAARGVCQRWLAGLVGADARSTSGEHLGRLAGFRNWKRGGTWVNVLGASRDRPVWEPSTARLEMPSGSRRLRSSSEPIHPGRRPGTDVSPSGRDWGWVCRSLENGCDPGAVYRELIDRAHPRRGEDALRYARRTMARALDRVGRSA